MGGSNTKFPQRNIGKGQDEEQKRKRQGQVKVQDDGLQEHDPRWQSDLLRLQQPFRMVLWVQPGTRVREVFHSGQAYERLRPHRAGPGVIVIFMKGSARRGG